MNSNTKQGFQEIGSTVEAIRKARKLSRADFAQQLGLAEKTVWNMEKGQGFTMESFLAVLRYTATDQLLFQWFREKATLSDLI